MTFFRPGFLLAALAIAFSAPAMAEDVEGSKDHPLVGRYEGSTIESYEEHDFDEAYVLQAPNDWTSKVPNNETDHTGGEWLGLEGRVVKIRYIAPEGRSSLEIYRNYQQALEAKGFVNVFNCKDAECFVGDHDALPYQIGRLFDKPGNDGAYWDHSRYQLSRLGRPEGAVYSMIAVGENKGAAVTMVWVIETKEMETGKIVVKTAEEMNQGILAEGSVNLYTLYFDFDEAVLKPESGPTLDEIAKLLNADPNLKLNIVGHTDNRGAADYNLSLSKRRAAAVVEALVMTRNINAARLTSDGAGMDRPIATNETEEGRALNRRVELVKVQ
ncbi:Peptidoglycan-associated lipoprotein [Alphaproteobacteria bacterium SO-S41]|nr:Peptidoglycan-associated lipoprotein [Alphaproteobacteria bacterium SO-S41]